LTAKVALKDAPHVCPRQVALMVPMLPPQQPVAAGLILRRRLARGSAWLLLQAAKHGEWGFPKGHQDAGETVVQTALRECAEECGIALVEIDGPEMELLYPLPDGRQKRVVYFPARTSTTQVQLSDEHTDAAWLNASQVTARLPHANLRALFHAVATSMQDDRDVDHADDRVAQ
jgi:bis(5'-nucleosidyl)-tetraphosphatase